MVELTNKSPYQVLPARHWHADIEIPNQVSRGSNVIKVARQRPVHRRFHGTAEHAECGTVCSPKVKAGRVTFSEVQLGYLVDFKLKQ